MALFSDSVDIEAFFINSLRERRFKHLILVSTGYQGFFLGYGILENTYA